MRFLFIFLLAFASLDCSPKLSPDRSWGNQRWVLVEMKGVPVQQSGGRRDAFISFDVREKKITGNGGCNQLSGNYLLNKNEIRFSEVISTKMSCEDIAFENTFLSVLGSIDHFEMNGNDIYLKKKRETLLIVRSK
ncbi:MAG: META domain-containing protein [Chitinophagaceae bacterium]